MAIAKSSVRDGSLTVAVTAWIDDLIVEKPTSLVEVVDRGVDEHPTGQWSGHGGVQRRGEGGVAMGGFDEDWGADLPGVDAGLGFDEAGIEPAGEADVERDVGGGDSGEGPVGVSQGGGNWLFTEDRLAVPSGGYDPLKVGTGDGGDQHRVDGWVGGKGLGRVVEVICAEVVRDRLGRGDVGVGDGQEFGVRDAAGDVFGVATPDRADPDDADAELCRHGGLLRAPFVQRRVIPPGGFG